MAKGVAHHDKMVRARQEGIHQQQVHRRGLLQEQLPSCVPVRAPFAPQLPRRRVRGARRAERRANVRAEMAAGGHGRGIVEARAHGPRGCGRVDTLQVLPLALGHVAAQGRCRRRPDARRGLECDARPAVLQPVHMHEAVALNGRDGAAAVRVDTLRGGAPGGVQRPSEQSGELCVEWRHDEMHPPHERWCEAQVWVHGRLVGRRCVVGGADEGAQGGRGGRGRRGGGR
mmetsp:Transcript_8735/g.27733  ORF Transcript_8735/g.27733 Transcript_8735/m.27733 type:complete len:229 (+) Transcript_8735:416-1102(+)